MNNLEDPEDIYNNPRNIFVAEFIGNPKMNILKIEKKILLIKILLNYLIKILNLKIQILKMIFI